MYGLRVRVLPQADTEIKRGFPFQWSNGVGIRSAGDNAHRDPGHLPPGGRPSGLLQDRSSARHSQDAWQGHCE